MVLFFFSFFFKQLFSRAVYIYTTVKFPAGMNKVYCYCCYCYYNAFAWLRRCVKVEVADRTVSVDVKQHWIEQKTSPPPPHPRTPPPPPALRPKLQALVYNILPSTTAVFSYAIGPRKLSANEQFFCWSSNSCKFVTNNSSKTRRVIYSRQQSLHQHK